jgi:hypothetical protein
VQLDQLLNAVEDRSQPQLQPLPRHRSPPAVADGPEAPVAFVDDSVPACSRARIDSENLHVGKVGPESDVIRRRHRGWILGEKR